MSKLATSYLGFPSLGGRTENKGGIMSFERGREFSFSPFLFHGFQDARGGGNQNVRHKKREKEKERDSQHYGVSHLTEETMGGPARHVISRLPPLFI